MADDKDPAVLHVETQGDVVDAAAKQGEFDGNVGLAGPGDAIYLIPTPSPDPRDPLNLPLVRKYLVLTLVAVFSTVGLTMISGFGGVLGMMAPIYLEQGYSETQLSWLMTFPSLFMGIGNLFGMPLVLSVGRRPVFLLSCLVLVFSGGLCVGQRSFTWHMAARCVMGLAAGQSEALCPLMIQETFFLHERALTQMWFTATSNIMTSVLSLLTSYIASEIGVSGWYGLGTGLAALVLAASVVFVPETRYDRPLAAYQGQAARVSHFAGTKQAAADHHEDAGAAAAGASYVVRRITTTEPRELDTVNYAPRTLASDMRLFVHQPEWAEALRTVRQMATVMLFPDILWAFLLNGLTIGVNIALSTTYSAILEAPPYSWPSKYVSFATGGQIIVSLIGLPLLGAGSDAIARRLARRNKGIHRPEHRLVPLALPVAVGTLAAVLYGQAAAHPGRLHWPGAALVFALNAYYFAFVGANICGITYALDAYPTRAAPALVVICAVRGILSFGTAYGVAPFVRARGYDGAFLVYGVLTGVLGALGGVVYVLSARIRRVCGRWAVQGGDRKGVYS